MVGLKKQTYPTPILEILALKSVSRIIDSSIVKINDSNGEIKDNFNNKQHIINKKISELEPLRETAAHQTYRNGSKKSTVHKRDGVPHGKREEWYENGTSKIVAEYLNGSFIGHYTHWREDGTKLMHIKSTQRDGMETREVYMSNGTIIFQSGTKQGSGWCKLRLWNNVPVGLFNINGCTISKFQISLKCAIRPKVWFSLLKARKVGDDQEGFDEYSESLEKFREVMLNMENWLKST